MEMQGGEKFKLENVLYVPQAVKNLLRVSRFMTKGDTMEDLKDNMNIKKNVASVNPNTIKGQNGSTMFYLRGGNIIPIV